MLLALLLVLGQALPVHNQHTREVMRTGSRGSSHVTAPSVFPLCDLVTAGDKSGAWECMKGDGTMLSGSATTFVATGSPTNTTESGYAVRTYTSAQNDQQPANGALPASSFSVCMHHRSTTNTVSYLGGFANGLTNATFAVLPWEVAGGGNWVSYISDGVAQANYASSFSIVTGTWYLLCFTYERVGGAADNVGRTYVNGTETSTASNLKLAQALSSKWTTNGYVGGLSGAAKSTRGFFVTYKVLSAADIARLYAGLAP